MRGEDEGEVTSRQKGEEATADVGRQAIPHPVGDDNEDLVAPQDAAAAVADVPRSGSIARSGSELQWMGGGRAAA